MWSGLAASCSKLALFSKISVGSSSDCRLVWLAVHVATVLQRFAGWLSQILRREFAHARNFNSKSPPKVSACADFRHKFVTTNLQTSVAQLAASFMTEHQQGAIKQLHNLVNVTVELQAASLFILHCQQIKPGLTIRIQD